MNSLFEKIRRFMDGRNGFDKFSFALVFGYLLFNGLKMFFRFRPVPYYIMLLIALAFLGFAVFRILSKNVWKRQEEEQKFERAFFKFTSSAFYAKLKKKANRAYMRLSQVRTHRFRTCPQCNEHLRMSTKRGKRTITCPKCGKTFKVFIPF